MIISQPIKHSVAQRSATQRSATSSRLLKRSLDTVIAAIALVLGAPVMLLAAIAIKLEDGGPVFYRRRVSGLHGDFDAFKLRTMRVDADRVLAGNPALKREFEINFKLKNDPRITRAGAVLRRWSLDELPQLWNVLKGEMSMVGPRMVTPEELQKYGPHAWIFRVLKPGLTGYWQVQRCAGTSYSKRVEMDIFYAQHRSFLLDLKILARTPLAVFRGPEKKMEG